MYTLTYIYLDQKANGLCGVRSGRTPPHTHRHREPARKLEATLAIPRRRGGAGVETSLADGTHLGGRDHPVVVVVERLAQAYRGMPGSPAVAAYT